MPAGGRGYTRPPSLISLWSTAPFLLNNTRRHVRSRAPRSRRGCAPSRIGIEQMLWPEKRAKDPVLGDKMPGIIDRTTARSYVTIPAGFQPDMLVPLLQAVPRRAALAGRTSDGDIEIGPDPGRHAGGPDLQHQPAAGRRWTCCDRVKHDCKLLEFLVQAKRDLQRPAARTPATRRRARCSRTWSPPMLELSKCPDFVVNRGHYFGTDRFARGAGPERRGKARPDRVPEDVLGRPRATAAHDGAMSRRRRTYEYVVVGSGAGGGTVAARLAEAGQQGAAAGGRRRSARAPRRRRAASATATACPTTTTSRPSTPSPPRTRRCGGTSSSATTPTTRRQRRDPKYRTNATAGRSTACSIRAPARSAAAPRTTR